MRRWIEFHIVALLLITGRLSVQAQNSTVVTGGGIQNNNGSVSYSIGQVFYNVNTDQNGYTIEGMQQPYEISVTSAILTLPNYSMRIFPNPAVIYIVLSIEDPDRKNMTYQLYNLKGQRKLEGIIFEKETVIVTENLIPSQYILKVFQEGKELKTFKIIKY